MRWLNRKFQKIPVDIHSHLIPGVDDGARSMDHSLEMVRQLKNAGFQKLITTPHVHPRYPNQTKQIVDGLAMLKRAVAEAELEVTIEAAAEYYVDDQFISNMKSGSQFLSFGKNYLLIECSFVTKPLFFESVIYQLLELGYKPVFAHPERYKFLEGDIEWLRDLRTSGILFQVTLGSIGGYYGAAPRKLALELLHHDMVDFLGSDLHKPSQIEFLNKGLKTKQVQKLLSGGRLMNEELI